MLSAPAIGHLRHARMQFGLPAIGTAARVVMFGYRAVGDNNIW
jgi:hypothetical protein